MKPRVLLAAVPALLLAHAATAQTPPKLWEFTAGGWIVSSPAIGYDGTLFFGCSDSKLYALNPNGTFKWSFATKFSINSAPAIGVDGTIYFGSADTNFYALNTDGRSTTIKFPRQRQL